MMKNGQAMFRVLCFFCVLYVCIFLGNLFAVDTQYDTCCHSFSDASEVASVPQEWLAQPLMYNHEDLGYDLVVSLDQHLYPAVRDLIERYGREHELKIKVKQGDCGVSAGAINQKSADILGFCCPPSKADRVPGLQYATVGIMPLALFVHKSLPIDNIKVSAAQEMFSQLSLSWKEYGDSANAELEDLDIVPIMRFHCKERPGHWRLLLPYEDAFSMQCIGVGSIEAVFTTLEQYPGGIAGMETLYMQKIYDLTDKFKALSIDGVDPEDTDAVAAHKYPFYFVLNLAHWDAASVKNKHADSLIEYVLTSVDSYSPDVAIVPRRELEKNKWGFNGDELIGEPVSMQ